MISFDKFKNKRIAILGFGREGKSTLHFLLKIGVQPKDITLLDSAKQIDGMAQGFERIQKEFGIDPQFDVTFGNAYLDNLDAFDMIIKTPGISLYNPKVYPFRQKITSQAQIFFDFYQGRIIAVSGTKGKSTTATLIYEICKHAGKDIQLIGNIGNPVLDYLDIDDPASQQNQYVVFEISSYMLEGLKKTNYISILLNIYADHLDRHEGFENYKQAKLNLLNGSQHNLVRDEVIQKHDFSLEEIKDKQVYIFGHEGKYAYQEGIFLIQGDAVFDNAGILLRGEHNMMNISAVLGVCDIMDINPVLLKEVLIKFKGLPHRMEHIGDFGGIIRIDDAISTTPESTIQAIQTFGKEINTIFLGGTDRGYVFDDLIRTIIEYGIKNVVLFPESGKRILKTIKKMDAGEIRVFQTQDMKEAVRFAYEWTDQGKICLLSTASPSYVLRKNFEEKGNMFEKYIKELS